MSSAFWIEKTNSLKNESESNIRSINALDNQFMSEKIIENISIELTLEKTKNYTAQWADNVYFQLKDSIELIKGKLDQKIETYSNSKNAINEKITDG